ncbi:hypothetical protein [Segatella hominis]|uniref:hypothetical protein n=1 Tax=Segatella hominis TaxID=2518605 RepID=UPI0014301CF0|nr:hypothetical protein [Segatella hominis]
MKKAYKTPSIKKQMVNIDSLLSGSGGGVGNGDEINHFNPDNTEAFSKRHHSLWEEED